jgi:flagellar biosynthesis protein FlhG
MSDQADQLRHLASCSPPASGGWPRPPIIAVTGGKAGAGATTVAVNLGAALADAGLRVVIVDAALARPTLAQVAGVHARSTNAFAEVVSGSRSAAAALEPGPAGALLLANSSATGHAPNGSRRAQQRLLGELQKLAQGTDAIIVDTGSGVTPWTRRFWQRARLVIVVSTADDAGIKDSYATIKLAGSDLLESPMHLLVNQCDVPAMADAAHGRLAAACQRFLSRDVPAVPYLPLHRVDDRTPVHPPRVWEQPNTPFGHAVLWLGRAVTDLLATSAPPPLAA